MLRADYGPHILTWLQHLWMIRFRSSTLVKKTALEDATVVWVPELTRYLFRFPWNKLRRQQQVTTFENIRVPHWIASIDAALIPH